MGHCQSSGVRLLVIPAPSITLALPVPRQASLGQARAVHAEVRDGSGPAGQSGEPIAAAWAALAAESPVVAVWLVSVDPDGAAEGSAPVRRGPFFRRLGGALVVGQAPPEAMCVGEAAWEVFATQSAGMGGRSVDQTGASEWRQQSLEIWRRREGGQVPVVGPPDLPAVSVEGKLLADLLVMAATHASLTERFGESLAEARLEATRELAYGAGHEINNPLANIATRAQSLLLEERDPERRKRLATIVDQSFRARDLIGGMMLFARPPKPHPAVIDVSLLVAAVIDSLAAGAASRSIRLEYSPPPVPLPVVVDRAQIEEAIRMVVVNAVEAVADGGRVTLQACGRQEQGREWCAITIDDDGRGMDRQTAQRAFDPFFSGREAGRGVGLGLSKAWGYVTAAGGIIRIDSRPTQGTCVTILIPVG